jgi:hypothetical protein
LYFVAPAPKCDQSDRPNQHPNARGAVEVVEDGDAVVGMVKATATAMLTCRIQPCRMLVNELGFSKQHRQQ